MFELRRGSKNSTGTGNRIDKVVLGSGEERRLAVAIMAGSKIGEISLRRGQVSCV